MQAIQKWSLPTNMTEVCSFNGLARCYRKFVEKFSSIAVVLTHLTQRGTKFEWTEDSKQSFQEMKKHLVTAPSHTLPSRNGGFTIYSDASKMSLGCVLMQNGKVMAYASWQLKAYEQNCLTHNMEQAAVVTLKLWRHYLYKKPFKIFMNHKSLKYFFT